MATADLPALLPDDVLADVLRRLAPRHLAASRSVCKAWRAAVDAHGILRKEPLPLSLAGLLVNFYASYFRRITELFSRPSTSTGPSSSITGKHDYLPYQDDKDSSQRRHSWSSVRDHCNGLLLLDDYVLNPATGWLAPLPPRPCLPEEMNGYLDGYLAYDPTISLNLDYEVILVPRFWYTRDEIEMDLAIERSEWPPAQCVLHVFSSRTGSWEERSFVREGEAAGTIAGMRINSGAQYNAVCLGGAMYIHCQTDFVLRVSLSGDSKCQVIKLPSGIPRPRYPEFCLGRSEKGVYCASINVRYRYRLQVWILSKSCCKMEWVLKYDRDLEQSLKHKLRYVGPQQKDGQKVCGPWIIQDINYHYDKMEAAVEEESEWSSEDEDNVEALVENEIDWSLLEANKAKDMGALVEEEFEWNSEASTDEKHEWSLDEEDRDAKPYYNSIGILGFHPYKEIIFFDESTRRGLACHLNSLKIEDLGNLYPEKYNEELPNERFIESCFPYTPCWL